MGDTSRVEENTAADCVELSEDELDRWNKLRPAAGDRHEETQMARIERWRLSLAYPQNAGCGTDPV